MKTNKKGLHYLETKIWLPLKKLTEKCDHELTEPFFIELGMRKARGCKQCKRIFPQ